MSKAMIVVAAGTSTRFGSDKLMSEVVGRPLVVHTVTRVREVVDECVLVCRPDQSDHLTTLLPGVKVTVGGETRTESERAGLAALGGERDLIGVHDGARPLVSTRLIENCFREARRVGGAVPVLEPSLIIDRRGLLPVEGAVTVQTPQVFWGPELLSCFARAAQIGFNGDDTLDVVHRFGNLDVVAVPGDPNNLKVTFQEDLDLVSGVLEMTAHNGPR